MPDKIEVLHPAYTFGIRGLMDFNSALMMICNHKDAICRREKWGNTVVHVYADFFINFGNQLFIVNKVGAIEMYIPSLCDLMANDWLAG